jgi:hypothetical protein
VLDQDGSVLATRRIADGLAGVGELHALVASHVVDPAQVVVGSKPTAGCSSGRWWQPATRSMRSTPRWYHRVGQTRGAGRLQ